MVAAQAAIQVIKCDALVVRASELGEQIMPALKQILLDTCPSLVVDVRGVGLLIGIEFQAEYLAGTFMIELLKRKVIVSHSLNAHRVVRLTPSAVMTDAEVQWLLGAAEEAAVAISERYAQS